MSDIQQYWTYFIFDDIQSNEYGVWISGSGTYDAPVRDVEVVTIPGKSGDLVVDNGRFNNITITYPCFISRKFDKRFDIFKAAMLSKQGYFVLQDTYHPEEFRMASFTGGISPETGPYNRAGTFNLEFNCMPQRYLVSGNTAITLADRMTIVNPTQFPAKPLIRATSAGAVTIGGKTLTVNSMGTYDYIDIDCETGEAYSGDDPCNTLIYMPELLTIPAGESAVTATATGQITPRWWTI